MESVLDDCMAQFSNKYVIKEERGQTVLGLMEQKAKRLSWRFFPRVLRKV